MFGWAFIVTYFSCIITFSSLTLSEDGFQYLGNYYKRKSYENANFDELFDDFTLDPDVTSNEYKFIICKGLSAYFLISDRIEKLKRSKNENSLINDLLKFSSPPSVYNKNFTFSSVEGLSQIKVEDAKLTLNDSIPYFEVKSEIYLASVTFKGVVEYNGSNQSLDYEMSDVLYTDWQRKRLNDECEIKLSRSFEKFHVNTTKVIVKNAVNIDAQYRELENEITKDVSKYLPKVVEQIRSTAKNVTLSADIRYMQINKEKNVRKLSVVISNAIKMYGNISANIPRFSFVHENLPTTFDLISAVFEMDAGKTNVSVTLQDDGDFALVTPAEGTLTYFVTEQNCTESCNTYGDQAKIRAVDVTITFNGRKVDKVSMTMNLEPGNAAHDHYLRKPADSITKSMLTKILKLLSDRLSARLKVFLK